MSSYIDMEIDWILHLSQIGQKLEGTGEKIKVNNQELKFSERTNINLSATISGSNFTIQYVENGKLRQTSGTFHGEIDGNAFKGVFTQTASDSKGVIHGKKRKEIYKD